MTASRMMALGLALFFSLAGCLDGPAPAGGPSGGGDPTATDVNDGNSTLYSAPRDLPVGRWWNYDVVSGPNQLLSYATLTVTAGSPDSYTVDTDNRTQAVNDAKHDVSFIGALSRADLAGGQHGHPVQFFRFPLRAGDEWTTTWDNATRTVRALGVTDGEFLLEALEDGTPRVRYSYHPLAGFFGQLAFLGADGNPMYRMGLKKWGDDYDGKYVRASVQLVHSRSDHRFGAPASEQVEFDVPAGVSELNFRFEARCISLGEEWSFHYYPKMVDATSTGDGFVGDNCPSFHSANFTVAAPQEGEWVYVAQRSFVVDGSYWEAELEARTFVEASISPGP